MKFYEVYGEFGVGKEMMATGRKGTLIIRVGQIVKVELCKRNGMVTSHSLFHPPCHGKVRVEHTLVTVFRSFARIEFVAKDLHRLTVEQWFAAIKILDKIDQRNLMTVAVHVCCL